MRSYILSVCAAAIIAAILGVLAGNGSVGKLVKMLSGLFLAVTLLGPLVQLKLPSPSAWIEDFSREGRDAAEEGIEKAREYSSAIISAEVEAYILDKAALLGADLDAAVTLDSNGFPEAVTLTGKVSAFARERLARRLEEELGLGEEAQVWMD